MQIAAVYILIKCLSAMPVNGIIVPVLTKKSSVAQTELLSGLNQPEFQVIKSPFLKWAGRKTSIVSSIKELLPMEAKRFIEPFVGSGAVFLNTDYQKNLLADTNADLIHLFQILKSDGEKFVKRSKKLFVAENNQENRFYELRKEFNESTDLERRAELFIYLNRHCYNGLCRYNKRGEFNVPFGRYHNPYFPTVELTDFGEKLSTAELAIQDFRQTLGGAGKGDIVYCDPPYVPLTKTSSFTDYAKGGFGPEEQKKLVSCCISAAKRGAFVAISNHDTPETRELYEDARQIVPLLVQRFISCNGESRNKVKELIAVFD